MQLLPFATSETSSKPLPAASREIGEEGQSEDGLSQDGFALLFEALWANAEGQEPNLAALELAGAGTEEVERFQQLMQFTGMLSNANPEKKAGVDQSIMEMLAAFLAVHTEEPASAQAATEGSESMLAELMLLAGGGEGAESAATPGEAEAAPTAEQLEQTLAELLQQLPASMQERLQRWAGGGNTLPAAAGEALTGPQPGAQVPVMPWIQVARKLLGAGPGLAEGTSPETQLPEGEGENESISEPDPLSLAKSPVARSMAAGVRTDPSALAAAIQQDAPQLPEPGRLQQALSQVQEILGARPEAMSAFAPSSGQQAMGTTGVQSSGAPTLSIPQPPGEPAWERTLGERVLWMAGQRVQQAEVRINPPQLGPVEIRVAVQNEQASVTFTAQHPFTREAIEAALPRLREMLADANLNLVNVDVGQRDSGGSRARSGRRGDFPAGGEAMRGMEPVVAMPAATVRSGVGLVDDFA